MTSDTPFTDHNIAIFKQRISLPRALGRTDTPPLLVFASPVIRQSVQYIDISQVISYPQQSDDKEDIDFHWPLLAHVLRIEQLIHTEISGQTYQRALFALQNVSKAKTDEIVMHQVLRLKVFETLAWANNDASGVPIQLDPLEFPSCGLSRTAVLTHENNSRLGTSDWYKTLDAFLQTMRLDTMAVGQHDLAETQGDKVLTSLFRRITLSNTSQHQSSVISNLCGAALGLRALVLVSRSTFMRCHGLQNCFQSGKHMLSKYKTKAPRKSDSLFSLDLGLLIFGQEHSGVADCFGGMSDFHLLRPLYAAISYTPICLLADRLFVTKKNNSTPLHVFFQVCILTTG